MYVSGSADGSCNRILNISAVGVLNAKTSAFRIVCISLNNFFCSSVYEISRFTWIQNGVPKRWTSLSFGVKRFALATISVKLVEVSEAGAAFPFNGMSLLSLLFAVDFSLLLVASISMQYILSSLVSEDIGCESQKTRTKPVPWISTSTIRSSGMPVSACSCSRNAIMGEPGGTLRPSFTWRGCCVA